MHLRTNTLRRPINTLSFMRKIINAEPSYEGSEEVLDTLIAILPERMLERSDRDQLLKYNICIDIFEKLSKKPANKVSLPLSIF